MSKFLLVACLTLFVVSAAAQELNGTRGRPLADLLKEGFGIASTTSNGRVGEIVLTLHKDASYFVCVLQAIRGSDYAVDPPQFVKDFPDSVPKPKPVALPCIPLN